ncbi:rRNA biogenesis protein RRP36 [Hypsizygus marmoreus]|uniref:rRNA biogenesis protein RRP36 n=1 Tax=Hypsizygus marmoreus TaxID=39966 RepID=A0A369KFG7_HYPMA|nr:rRNA biogenesis protein RRP36 [Hypsizygus marmoreus]
MPRRPRPASRVSSKKVAERSTKVAGPSKLPKRAKSPTPDESDESDPEERSDSGSHENLDNDSGLDEASGIAADDDEEDVDAPRVVQWVDEEDFEDDGDRWNVRPSDLKSLEDDLSGLPLGALRKAQHVLKNATIDSDGSDESEGENESDEEPNASSSKGKEKAKPEWSIKPRTDIAKRSSKHAPIEVTSKRPVTRHRTVVDVKMPQPRDPRFLPLAGEFSADKFQASYNFLADAHQTELTTLRENLKRARKLLTSSPRDLYEERLEEVNRLELAVKRAESLVNKDRRDAIEQETLKKLSMEEHEKRKGGKGEWYLKNSDKRELLVRARYDALAADGGKRAVKKAIEKKQKKLGQKEKKSRPYPKGGVKRSFEGNRDGGQTKRRRVGS